MRSRRFFPAVLFLAACASTSQNAVHARDVQAESIRVVARFELLGARTPAHDLRWASETSAFVSTTREQVAEHRLAPGLPVVRQLFPSPLQFDPGMIYGHLAVSAETLVVSQTTKKIAWRPVARDPGGPVIYERQLLGQIEDIDVLGDRLAWVGWPAAINHDPDADLTGIAWIDRLGDHLQSPENLLRDDLGPKGGGHLNGCWGLGIGALRFQADGSLFVAPGVVDEIALFDPAGRKLRGWNASLFGIDTTAACAGVSEAQRRKLNAEPLAMQGWVNRHGVIDEALATPMGPAIVVRTLKNGLPAWRLHILRPTAVLSYDLPLVAASPFDRLAADVRGSKIAVLLSDESRFPKVAAVPDRIVILSLPNIPRAGGK